MPKPVSEKLAFVTECATQLASMAEFRIELDALVLAFEAILRTRHDLMHGALSDLPVKNGVFTFIRLEAHPDSHEVKEFHYDLKKFPELEASLVCLGSKAPELARRVFAARPKPS